MLILFRRLNYKFKSIQPWFRISFFLNLIFLFLLAENEEGEKQEVKVQNDSDLEAMIDPILREMDSNNDGYVDYAEFKKAS